MTSPHVSVIIPARDAQDTLALTLSALASEQVRGGHEVIVVDNGSRDETAALADRSQVVSRVLRRPRGDGPGAARNAGVEIAAGSVLAFLDADCRPASGWLSAGARATEAADLVQGRVLPDPNAHRGPFDRTLAVNGAYGLFESANLFVRRSLFESLAGFPAGLETTGAPFGEDVIFGWRARRAGARTSFCEQALAYHVVVARSAAEFVAERKRLALFPPLAAQVPELRDSFFYHRYFLNHRSARFDLAVAGAATAVLVRRALPLALAIPYLRTLSAARSWGVRRAAQVAATEAIADAVGGAALLRGTVRHRSLLV